MVTAGLGTNMEVQNNDSAGTNVIQALSSSAATASTLNHTIEVNQGSPLDSNSFSHSEGDGLDNVPPPPPPLGIETQFELLNISNSEHLKPNINRDQLKNVDEYQPYQNSSRRTIFQKLHNLGLANTGSQSRRSTNNERQKTTDGDEYGISGNSANLINNDELHSTYTSSHFATLRRMCSHRQNRKNSIISNDRYDEDSHTVNVHGMAIKERLPDTTQIKQSNRKSNSSISRKSLTSYGDIDTTDFEYNDDGPVQRAKSESMSSLSSRGSTLSWFRKRTRILGKGI